jgi:hypothetical protein
MTRIAAFIAGRRAKLAVLVGWLVGDVGLQGGRFRKSQPGEDLWQPMRPLLFLLAAFSVPFAAGCGNDESTPPAAGSTIRTPGHIEFELEDVGPGAAGGARATLRSSGASQTRIVVEGLGEGAPGGGGPNQSHLHRGTCEHPASGGSHQLKPLTGDESATVVAVPLANLLTGEWFVDIHLPRTQGGGDPEVVACGDVPDATGPNG